MSGRSSSKKAGQKPTRAIWCSVGATRLRGKAYPGPTPARRWWQRILGLGCHGGIVFEFERVDLDEAERCLAAFLASPGEFAVETCSGSRVEVLSSPGSTTVTLDCWFSDLAEDIDTAVVRHADAREVLGRIFELESDHELADCIRELERDAERRR